MKKKILVLLSLIYVCNVYSQEVEKLGEIQGLYSEFGYAGGPGSPSEIYVDEINNLVKIINRSSEYTYYDLNTLQGVKKEPYRSSFSLVQKELGEYEISFCSETLRIAKNGKEIKYIAGTKNISTGISFILKKGEGYIVYYVHKDGTPGAVDTEGKIYSNREALEYLKECDVEKYEESLVRAEELGLKEDFEEGKVLIWGKTYYKPDNSLNQYDSEGNKYRFLYLGLTGTFISCRKNTDEENLCNTIDANKYSTILSTEGASSYSWYVGYGGNIYYYIAGEEYTEVFRIRRTWGKADMYSMAINGYTEDNYGEYVKTTLSTMSKSDLRLLRNTIFALYGVHFKSADLSAHFAKEVWYIDEGKSSGEVDLPAHRQKLVEMIQEAERSGAR